MVTNEAPKADLRRQLQLNPTDLEIAKQYWNSLADPQGDVRSGEYVIEAFQAAALSSRDGGVALANAYRELYERSGELPRSAYFDNDLVRALERWLLQLGGEEYITLKWLLESLAQAQDS